MRELIELNRYLHDFTSALWICGSLLLWLLLREARRSGVTAEIRRALGRIGAKIRLLTIPSLLISLVSGGIRAATFARFEYVGEVTSSVVVALVVKHIVFAVVVGWGLWIHWKSKSGFDSPPGSG